MVKIKICGLRREEDISYVNECNPDYVGFVFAKSRRQVTREQAKHLRSQLNAGIIPVGVFVNEEMETIAELVLDGIIDVVQLHGEETEQDIERLRELTNKKVKIIKAIRVESKSDIEKSREFSADYLLFDTFSKEEYGGTGKTFDWTLLKEVQVPFFLAGGISSTNIKEAADCVTPYAFDVSSAVETDGCKDREKILSLMDRTRQINARRW